MADKNSLRNQFRLIRKAVNDREHRAQDASARIVILPEWQDAHSVLLYRSWGSEMDTTFLIREALATQKCVYLPVTDPATMTLSVGLFSEELPSGPFGIPEPHPIDRPVVLDLILVPGLAFDHRGGRIGQGKGFYDRFLATTDAFTIGFGFHAQLTESVPMELHDRFLSMIVTESEVIRCGGL